MHFEDRTCAFLVLNRYLKKYCIKSNFNDFALVTFQISALLVNNCAPKISSLEQVACKRQKLFNSW